MLLLTSRERREKISVAKHFSAEIKLSFHDFLSWVWKFRAWSDRGRISVSFFHFAARKEEVEGPKGCRRCRRCHMCRRRFASCREKRRHTRTVWRWKVSDGRRRLFSPQRGQEEFSVCGRHQKKEKRFSCVYLLFIVFNFIARAAAKRKKKNKQRREGKLGKSRVKAEGILCAWRESQREISCLRKMFFFLSRRFFGSIDGWLNQMAAIDGLGKLMEIRKLI
jgi:hypothetical protein